LLKKSLAVGIIFFLVISNAPYSTLSNEISTSTFGGNILYVGGSGPGNYSIIQDAINDASDGDTVYVYDDSSPYYENVIVNKTISLTGEDRNSTIIDGSGKQSCILIRMHQVEISNFMIKNTSSNRLDSGGIMINSGSCRIYNILFSNNKCGLYGERSGYNDIFENTFFHNGYAITLWQYCYGNRIENNSISYSNNMGALLYDSHGCEFIGNNICNNSVGISTGPGSDECIIENNFFSENNKGLNIRSDGNSIIENTFSNNNVAIYLDYYYLWPYDYYPSGNNIYHNNFLNNTVEDEKSCDNKWDNDYTSGGNYWSFYNGIDSDGDDIGDNPYNIPGGDDKDRYPYMNINGWINSNLPDLSCYPSLNWVDVKPGSTVNRVFFVENIGAPNTMLDWEVSNYPSWGVWTFNPDCGYDLKPDDRKVHVKVTVTVPNKKNKEYTETIRVSNKEYFNDYELIQVSLSTPKNKAINTPFLQFLENHPYMFPFLRHLMRLQ